MIAVVAMGLFRIAALSKVHRIVGLALILAEPVNAVESEPLHTTTHPEPNDIEHFGARGSTN